MFRCSNKYQQIVCFETLPVGLQDFNILEWRPLPCFSCFDSCTPADAERCVDAWQSSWNLPAAFAGGHWAIVHLRAAEPSSLRGVMATIHLYMSHVLEMLIVGAKHEYLVSFSRIYNSCKWPLFTLQAVGVLEEPGKALVVTTVSMVYLLLGDESYEEVGAKAGCQDSTNQNDSYYTKSAGRRWGETRCLALQNKLYNYGCTSNLFIIVQLWCCLTSSIYWQHQHQRQRQQQQSTSIGPQRWAPGTTIGPTHWWWSMAPCYKENTSWIRETYLCKVLIH